MHLRDFNTSWKSEGGEGGRKLQHHEKGSFLIDNQVKICLENGGKIINDGVGGYSSEELHEHGDYRRMVENKKEVLRPIVEVRK